MPRSAPTTPLISKMDRKWRPHAHQFTDAYETSSPEYAVSKTHACTPLSYHRQVLLFHGIFETTSHITFNAGQIITVGINEPGCSDGHSVFGFVYEVKTSLARGQPWGYYWQMEVEVHTIPGYKVDWRHARPFIFPPIGSVFIQPHALKDAKFELLTPASPERWETVKVDLGHDPSLFDPLSRSYRLCRAGDRLPPREVYPQHEQHGPLAPARTLIRRTRRAAAPPPHNTIPSAQSLQIFDLDMNFLIHNTTQENRRLKLDEAAEGKGKLANRHATKPKP
jgi:hypothetical protein